MSKEHFKSGFANIIGFPNSGKSTLLNALIGEKMAIVSHKPQTTRQRIFGIENDPEYQLILSDTPGWIEKTAYPLHQMMNIQIRYALEDADLLIWVVDLQSNMEFPESFVSMIQKSHIPVILCFNKVDRSISQIEDLIHSFQDRYPISALSTHRISAKFNEGIEELKKVLISNLPVHPAYFPEDDKSDRSIRFFISELIREQIYLQYEAEIPYHSFVVVESCKGVDEQKEMAVIDAIIYVGRESHVAILIGKKASKLKELGIAARKEIEKFLNQKVYLNLSVKIKKDWRDNPGFVQKSGIFQ